MMKEPTELVELAAEIAIVVYRAYIALKKKGEEPKEKEKPTKKEEKPIEEKAIEKEPLEKK